MDAIETYQHKGLTIEIHQDTDASNPRKEWDNAGTMVCWHSRYDLGDDHKFTSPEDFREWWKENGKGGVLLNLFLYDHSGISISASSFIGRAQHAEWDSGQVGFIYATKETILKEWGKRGKKKAEKYLAGEVETYDQYLTGDVFGYIVKSTDGEHLDSCWGCYGMDYCKEEAESIAENHADGIKEAENMEQSAFAL